MNLQNSQRFTQHLLWRAGFFDSPQEVRRLSMMQVDEVVNELFSKSEVAEDLNSVSAGLLEGMTPQKKKGLNKEEKQKLTEQFRDENIELNRAWISRMATTEATLRERMTFFWMSHFATAVPVPAFNQQFNNLVRKNALGSFADLLLEVSKSPSMILYLNNQQNRKDHPNENFAREVMELFTLGRGNYSEQDIKESARAFTGWSFDASGNYFFRQFQHDDGIKTIFSKSGNFSGEDVIQMLLAKKETASHIVRKIYFHFVNEEANDIRIGELADFFFSNHYDISLLMKKIFTSDWFYEEENIGTRIKSPVELMAGMMRMFSLDFGNEMVIPALQKLLGQILFFPPNVAGWPGGKTWIDSSTLLLRLRIPQFVFNAEEVNLQTKDDFSVDPSMLKFQQLSFSGKFQLKDLQATYNWNNILSAFSGTAHEKLLQQLHNYFLQTNSEIAAGDLFSDISSISDHESKIKTIAIRLMSLPEYQLN